MLDYKSPPPSQFWIGIAAIASLIDLAFFFYVGRHVIFDPQYGLVYGFNGYARPMILLSQVVNVAAFLLVLVVILVNHSRYCWLLCLAFVVHVYVAFGLVAR